MDRDNKYDTSFRRSEIGIEDENREAAHLKAEEDFRRLENEHLERLADKFGGGRGWE